MIANDRCQAKRGYIQVKQPDFVLHLAGIVSAELGAIGEVSPVWASGCAEKSTAVLPGDGNPR